MDKINSPFFHRWRIKAKQRNRIYASFLQKTPPKKILALLPSLHEEAFSLISCLECAACCKNYSPRFKAPDIRRISKYLRLTETEFSVKYLQIDDENDSVLKTLPCSFLEDDHTCTIYGVRPGDCSGFPYTDQDIFFKKPAITLINITFCPIAYYVMEKMIERIEGKI
jgi:uncharacterized protein